MVTTNIRRLMKEKGIGNKALSEASNIPIGTLNKIIYGETTNPSLGTLTALSRALECTLDELIDDLEKNNLTSLRSSEEQLLIKYRELNEEGQSKVDIYVDDIIATGLYKKK